MSFIDKLLMVDKRRLKKITRTANMVMAYEDEMKKLTDDELKAKTPYFKELLKNGKTLDDILPEAYAVVRETARRVRGEFPYKVQVMGGIVLHEGDVAEMKTGEGKTLTETMPAYLNALEGKGVHIVTVNEYLAARDAENMGQIYNFLGLTVDVNLREKDVKGKQAAYNADITYTTNSELGFDYLRDNMAQQVERRVLRGLNYAIVDEADSILIDESRTPLIISGGERASASTYIFADRFTKSLRKDKDFTIDIKTKTCSLTDSGIDMAEKAFNIKNIYDSSNPANADLVHRITQALKANYIMKRGVEYMVKDNEILLIDAFTGRVLKGREYSDGLQQALQAKENVKIKQETITMATITYQNFFGLYNKIAGMTGTAKTEEEEFREIYKMNVTCVPTNRPVVRYDDIDMVYGNEKAKYQAILEEIKKRHALGQPILVGTVSVEKSEYLSSLLLQAGLQHEVLNAKNHEREAHIIEHAGELGSITVATNMAGRGTDIKLGPGVLDIKDTQDVKHAAGLCVIGTERHEARRIDNQLRGRSGRQGDPGYSKFFVCCDDELILRFGSDMLRNAFASLGDEGLNNKFVTSAITSAQKKIEGQNFDTRKSLIDYDNVMRNQRTVIYEQRDKVLYSESIFDAVNEYFKKSASTIVDNSMEKNGGDEWLDAKKLHANLASKYLKEGTFNTDNYQEANIQDAKESIADALICVYTKKRNMWIEKVSKEAPDQIEKMVTLRAIDRYWTNHIDAMSKLRDGIHLRSYAQSNPLQEYVKEGYQMFDEMVNNIANEVTSTLLRAEIQIREEKLEQMRQGPSETDAPEQVVPDAKKLEEIKKEQEEKENQQENNKENKQ